MFAFAKELALDRLNFRPVLLFNSLTLLIPDILLYLALLCVTCINNAFQIFKCLFLEDRINVCSFVLFERYNRRKWVEKSRLIWSLQDDSCPHFGISCWSFSLDFYKETYKISVHWFNFSTPENTDQLPSHSSMWSAISLSTWWNFAFLLFIFFSGFLITSVKRYLILL